MRLSRLVVAILVLVAIVVFPVHLALAQAPPPDPTRSLPAKVERGETFVVTINFTCPADDFNGINLRDTAPDGWSVEANKLWCDPYADWDKVEGGNQVQLLWLGPYFLPDDENFTATYKVTVPCGASLGNHSFNVDYPVDTVLRWHIENDVNMTNITGPHVVEVIGSTIAFTPVSIDFYGAVNGTNPQDQTMELWGSTSCMFNWSLSDDADYEGHDWLSESPTNGSCTDDVHGFATLSVNTSGMPEGEYFANITINASEANNPQHIVPVALHMSVTDVLKGHVNFDGRGSPPNDKWIEPFEVWLFNSGTADVLWEGVCTTNSTGWFNISDIVVGTYDIGIKNWTCLSELVTNVTVTEGVGALADFGTTREGDVNNNDYIDIDDYIYTVEAFDSTPSDGNWNELCDFNRNSWIDIDDYIMVTAYFDMTGELFGRQL